MAESKTRKRRLRARRRDAGLKAHLVWLSPEGRGMHPNDRHPCRLLWLRIACGLVLTVVLVASGEERMWSAFYVDYAVVQRDLKGNQGLHEELMEIAVEDTSNTLGNFWYQRAARHCGALIKEAIKVEVQRTPKRKKEDMLRDVLVKTAPCRYSYYVDHWDEINQMIQTQYQALKNRGSR